jgi:putative hydrolase of HD superfamily
MNSDAQSIIDFLHEAEKLKTEMRHNWLSNGRRESVAEHSWRMALMATLMHSYLDTKVDLSKSIRMAIVHDLVEINFHDIPAFKVKPANKSELERKSLQKLVKILPLHLQKEIIDLWEEYEAATTSEAIFVKALDKTEVLLQHNEADIKHLTKKEIPFNLVHGKIYTDKDSFLKEFRKLMDIETISLYENHKIPVDLYKNAI